MILGSRLARRTSLWHQRRSPAVVAGGRDLQQAGHAGDLEVRALSGHQRKSFCFGGFEAKYAAAFPKKARSLSCSATWRRKRNSSVRSAALNGSSEDPATVSSRRRSSRTHRANELSTTDNSAATSAIVLPVSITRCAASVLNSSVNLRLVAPISDILPADQRSACQVSTKDRK